jgi:tetratricopeptide (TPR) repeat protein
LLLESEVQGRSGKIKEAIDSLTEYLAQRPEDPYALYQRALHQRAQGRLAPAIDDLQTLKRADPLALDLQPRFLLVRLFRQAGKQDLQIRELESLVQDAPESVKALEQLVSTYIDEQRAADAERIVTAQINRAADKPDARWLFLRGRISLEFGDYGRALTDFQRAAETSGYTTASVAKVLDLYVQANRAADGIEYYQRHVPVERASSALAARYALLLVKADRKQEAVRHFRRAMSLALSDGPEAIADVNASLHAAFPPTEPNFESVNEAVALFESQTPGAATRRVNNRILAHLYRAAQRYDDAAAGLQQLVATCTDERERVNLLFDLAELYMTAGDAQRARRKYEDGLQYDSDNWIALNNLAYLLSDALGEYKLARPYAERAVALSDNAAALDTLGWIYVGLEEYSLAIAELSRAIRLAPGDPLAYYHLGEAYRRNGQFTAAASILTAGQELVAGGGDAELEGRLAVAQERVARSDRSP